ncbi:MAG: M23 family metallopeptidase [Sphingomonadales bacterium]
MTVSRLLGLCILLLSAWPAQALELRGAVTQGGFVIGRVAPEAQVSVDGQTLRLTPDGLFAFGIGRDAQGDVALTVDAQGKRKTHRLAIAPRAFAVERVDGVPQKTVVIPEAEKQRRARERAMVAEARAVSADLTAWARGFIVPVEGARISGVYGSQRILNGVPRWPHYGIDYAAPIGTPVKAPAAGVVRLAEADFLLEGGLIIIDHGYGVTSTLMHLNSVAVKAGDTVAQGAVVGTVGMTGRANGPHLDWRMNVRDARVDPALVLQVKADDWQN